MWISLLKLGICGILRLQNISSLSKLFKTLQNILSVYVQECKIKSSLNLALCALDPESRMGIASCVMFRQYLYLSWLYWNKIEQDFEIRELSTQAVRYKFKKLRIFTLFVRFLSLFIYVDFWRVLFMRRIVTRSHSGLFFEEMVEKFSWTIKVQKVK